MYRVLIVDDEPIAVESIAYTIKNNFEVIDRIDKARSGKEAIEKSCQLHPDIIIMDINMPGINGIDAMKQIRLVDTTVNFIVISAFDYFDYAVEAVALGVVEYLLKPVKEVKLIETLRKLLSQIEQSNRNRKKLLDQQERLEMIAPLLEKGFMHSLCMYGEDTKELQNYFDLLGCHNSGGYVMAIEFRQKRSSQRAEHSGNQGNSEVMDKIGAGLQGEKMYETYKNIIKASFNCIVSPIILNRIIVYIFDDSVEGVYEQKSKAIHGAQKILERASRIYPEIFIGIGRYYINNHEAKKSYQEALHALRILADNEGEEALPNPILHEDDIAPMIEMPESDYEQLIEEEICSKISDNNGIHAQIAFEQIYERMCSDTNMNFDQIKKRMIGLIVGFGKRWENMLDDNFYGVLSEIINADNKQRLYQIGKLYINQVIHQTAASRQKKANSIIEKANQYIKEHYAEDISLEDIAKEVNLSSYYFSRFYKDAAGIGFSDRLVTVRIEKAKEYLKKEELSIKDVSYMVGFMDPNYFSKIFKKATGLTASEYKKMYGI